MLAQLDNWLNALKVQGLHRSRRTQDKAHINFSSNDYLSLGEEPHLKQAYQEGFQRYGSASGGSIVICGYHGIHKALEESVSDWLQADEALLFGSGYTANLAIIALLAKLSCSIVLDKKMHASFYDGLKMQQDTRYVRFIHNDWQDAANKLKKHPGASVLLTEGIFSMSGQVSPLSKLVQVSKNAQSNLIVDEAHSIGILGNEGAGAVAMHDLNQTEVPLRVIPFGKAFASQGAVVVGNATWIDALLQAARPALYSTAISPGLCFGLMETLAFVRTADERRDTLWECIRYFCKKAVESPLHWEQSTSPIQFLKLGCPKQALACTQALMARGIFCQAVREPTVTPKETGLRVVLNYHHQPADIDCLFDCLHELHA